MAKTRRTFTPEFEAQAVKRIADQGKSIAEVARDLDLSLEMAVARRLPGEGLVAHSGRGSPCASEHYRRILSGHGIACTGAAGRTAGTTRRWRASSPR